MMAPMTARARVAGLSRPTAATSSCSRVVAPLAAHPLRAMPTSVFKRACAPLLPARSAVRVSASSVNTPVVVAAASAAPQGAPKPRSPA